jgi:hypothetical protein
VEHRVKFSQPREPFNVLSTPVWSIEECKEIFNPSSAKKPSGRSSKLDRKKDKKKKKEDNPVLLVRSGWLRATDTCGHIQVIIVARESARTVRKGAILGVFTLMRRRPDRGVSLVFQ